MAGTFKRYFRSDGASHKVVSIPFKAADTSSRRNTRDGYAIRCRSRRRPVRPVSARPSVAWFSPWRLMRS